MNSPAMPACTSSDTYGVTHFGCRRPNGSGRKRSMPATKGSRAVAANHPLTPPTAFSVTSAASGTSHTRFIRARMV